MTARMRTVKKLSRVQKNLAVVPYDNLSAYGQKTQPGTKALAMGV